MTFVLLFFEDPAERGKADCFAGVNLQAVLSVTNGGFSFKTPGGELHEYDDEWEVIKREDISRHFPAMLLDGAVEAVEKGGAEAVWVGTYGLSYSEGEPGLAAAHSNVS
ncbi:hypothetical protein HY311_01640 [Candidatus Nomurabacteria bacterium]|nr:hypothetical protein [Candidatus Nomurabacteria bacterium]